ncbi:MAG: hypothetical protein ACRDRL_11690 [Sciscionella sp.]
MRLRRARSGKFSVLGLIEDHYNTLRHFGSGRRSPIDHLMLLGLPALAAVTSWSLGGRVRNVPEVLAATAILTGLIFTVFVLVFDLATRAAMTATEERRGLALQLADELRANVSYAVLMGLLLSALLGGLAMFTDAAKPLPRLLSAVIVYGGLHLLLSVFMILKRVRSMFVLLRSE